jgi:shikimate kinase
MRKNIYLVGFMGAGKSTVGRILARRLGLEFRDTDVEVVARTGFPIPEIFSRFGEEGFRAREREAVAAVCRERGLVVALGGGAPLDDRNWRLLKRTGVTVYLREDPAVLAARLVDDDSRPLLRGYEGGARLGRIARILAAREPRYLEADVVVECRGRSPEEIAGEVLERLRDEDA